MAEARGRGWFGPLVLLGLGSSGLLAVVAGRDWFRLDGVSKVALSVPESELRADMPLALALALVVLAAWGVVLVTRRRGRRFVLALAGLAGAGVMACLVVAPYTLPDQIRDGLAVDRDQTSAEPTAAYVIACVAVLLCLATTVVAWRLAPRWPTMSSRYDAPAVQSTEAATTDLWKALDEGRDPTDPAAPPTPQQ